MRALVLLLSAIPLAAQTAPRTQPGFDAIQISRLKADLTFLSSDALDGRRSLDRGSEIAIQWIASEFAKAGLAPAAGDSYLQPVPLFEFAVDRSLTTLTLRRGGLNSETFRAPDAVANTPLEGSFAGSVVFAGFGITAPELGYDDYAGIDAAGKIVLIFSHEPQEDNPDSVFNGKGNTRYLSPMAKLRNAERHGALAVLTMSDPNHESSVRTGGRGQQGAARPRILSEQLIDSGPAIPAFTVSEKLSSALFAAGRKKASDVQSAIDDKAAPASFDIPGARIELHVAAAEKRRARSYNVAGLIEGSDPVLRDETIVFSAHFDHDGSGPAGIYHGADDNGSGTVGVVELARAFVANPVKPKRSLLFIVFAAEERGLLGSYYYAAHPLRPLATTRAQINFDMIGRNEAEDPRVITTISPDTSNELGLLGTHYSPDYREIVERHNQSVGLNLNYKWDFDAYNQILFRSDQYPLLLANIPAVWWFTGFHPDYHQVTDTFEKINFVKMVKILKLAYLTGFEFADGRSTPRFETRAKAKR